MLGCREGLCVARSPCRKVYGMGDVIAAFFGNTVCHSLIGTPNEWSWHLTKNQLTENVRVYFWTLSSIPLSYMSVLTPVPHFFVLISIYLDVLGLSFGMWDLVPQPEIEPRHSALGTQCLSHWTIRKVPQLCSLLDVWCWGSCLYSLSLCFPICKMGLVIVPPSWGWYKG